MSSAPDPHAAAREALTHAQHAQRAPLSTSRDHTVHGLATMAFGLTLGLYVVGQRVAQGHLAASTVVTVLYVGVLVGLAVWQKRAGRTVPRGARRLGSVGLAGSVALLLVTTIWLNVRQAGPRTAGLPDQVDAWWVYVIAAAVVALPMALAGAAIVRRRPR